METCKTRTIVRAMLKKQEDSPDLFSNRTGSSHHLMMRSKIAVETFSGILQTSGFPANEQTRRKCQGSEQQLAGLGFHKATRLAPGLT